MVGSLALRELLLQFQSLSETMRKRISERHAMYNYNVVAEEFCHHYHPPVDVGHSSGYLGGITAYPQPPGLARASVVPGSAA
jgi:hypothetical protein